MKSAFAFAGVMLLSVCLCRAEEVTFTHAGPVVGNADLASMDMTMKMEMTVNLNGAVAERSSNSMSQKKVVKETTLAVADKAATKTKVEIKEMKASQTGPDGKVQEEAAPIAGKTYILSLKDGSLTATTAAGGEVTAEELAALQNEYKRFGKPDPVAGFLDKKTVKTGETLSVPAELAAELFATEKGQKVEKMTFTLKATRDLGGQKCAVLDTVLNMSAQLGPVMKMTIEQKGEAVIAISTSELKSLELSGPVTMTGRATQDEQKIEFKGTGQSAIKIMIQSAK